MSDADFIKELSEVVSEENTKVNKIRKSQKNSKTLKIVFTVILIVVAIAVIVGLNSDMNLAGVKSGTLADYPNVTVGEAFDDFFGSPQWGVDKEGDQHYVTFTGKCEYFGEIGNVDVLFWVDETSFGISSMSMEGVPLTNFEQIAILNAVYGV